MTQTGRDFSSPQHETTDQHNQDRTAGRLSHDQHNYAMVRGEKRSSTEDDDFLHGVKGSPKSIFWLNEREGQWMMPGKISFCCLLNTSRGDIRQRYDLGNVGAEWKVGFKIKNQVVHRRYTIEGQEGSQCGSVQPTSARAVTYALTTELPNQDTCRPPPSFIKFTKQTNLVD